MNAVTRATLPFDSTLGSNKAAPLPCRVLILADLGLTKENLMVYSTQHYASFSEWLKHQQLKLQVELPESGWLTLSVKHLDDLHPEQLLNCISDHLPQVPATDDFQQLKKNQLALQLVNKLLHHPKIRQLEATWRSIDRLITKVANNPATEILLIHQSREELHQNLSATQLEESPLFHKIYAEELGQYGGTPYSLILVDQTWDNNQQDLNDLQALALLGQVAHAPVLTGVCPSLLGLDSFTQNITAEQASDLASNKRFLKLRHLVQQPASRYLSLLLPRVLVRPPYELQMPTGLFQEQASEGESALLWGNPCYSLASLVLHSFQNHGGYTGMLNSPGDEDPLIPPYQLNPYAPSLAPLEARWSQETLSAFTQQGFTLASAGKNNRIVFEQPVSLHLGSHTSQQVEPDFQLPYLLTLSRVAHYLKQVLREQLGSSDTLNSLETRLNQWLQTSVSAQEKPSLEVMHRKPFREAKLQIINKENQLPEIHLQLTPHLKHQGQSFTLNLTSSLAGDTHG